MTVETRAVEERLPIRRADQTLAKKQRVLDVARSEFVQHGYRAVTMEAIAQVSGVSKRSLYLWHEDKPALFKACLLDGARRFPLLQFGAGGDVEGGLHAFGVALLREFTRPNTIGMGVLLVREAHDFPELAELVRRNREQFLVQPLADHLRIARLADSDAAAELAELLISMILAPVHNHLLLGEPLPSEDASASHVGRAVATFLRGRKEMTQ